MFSTEPKTTENKPAGSKKLFCFKQHTPVQNKTLSDKDLQTQTFSQKNKEAASVKYYVAAAITIKPIWKYQRYLLTQKNKSDIAFFQIIKSKASQFFRKQNIENFQL